MRHWTWAVLALGVFAAAPARAQEPPARCVVERVAQGLLHCRGGERVRLILVDATALQMSPLGVEVDRALSRLLPPGTRARLEFDVQPRDRAGNLLAYAYTPDGRMVNEELARQGFSLGLVYPPNVRHAERIQAAILGAARSRSGVWEEPAPRPAAPARSAPSAAPAPDTTRSEVPVDSAAPDTLGLELLAQELRREGDLAVVEGRVRNLSSRPLSNIMVVATFRTPGGEPVVSETGLVAVSPVLPGQISSFRVVTAWMPAVGAATLQFVDLDGRAVPTRQAPNPP